MWSVRYLVRLLTRGYSHRKMKLIGTHNGTFHCDEVLACFLLKQLKEYRDAEIVRTRDPAVLQTCDVVVDVGGLYDPSTHRYDHHQRSFSESMKTLRPGKTWGTKLSSAGLVYLHHGQQILAQTLETAVDDPITDLVYDKVYEHFVEEIDAVDNGISVSDGVPRYIISTTISNRVGYLNPKWNEPDVDEEECFKKAMTLVGEEFLDRVLYYKNAWLPARVIVEEAVKNRLQIDTSGEVVALEKGGCPWKDHLFSLETELFVDPLVKFVLYPDSNNKWRVQCVPVRLGSFENRLSLPEQWRGVRDEELSKLTGIPGCVFVHANGFIGGNVSYEGALEMARQALKKQSGAL
ncbi:MYG1 exonuclease-like [Liolophura sinensis]|uniref:MYG1 exonuclease-like n=1 Tax=Liolophura sinensis TaxID=3198878 RepID=UPI0031581E04